MSSVKKLKIGMIGGGNESFMGHIHRLAIEKSGCLDLVSGAFGTTRQRSFETGKSLGLDPKRTFGVYRDLFRKEQNAKGDDRLDFVTILAPNNMHYPVTMAAFDAGFPVFSEKPMSCNMDEALNLKRKALTNDSIYATAYVYTFYPAVVEMKKFLASGELGMIRRVNATYLSGWMGQRVELDGNRSAGWRVDARRAGNCGVLYDHGGHCAFLTEYLTGLHIIEVNADAKPTIAGRQIDDDADVLVHLENGVRGVFSISQITFGEADGLSIAIYGSNGTVKWSQSAAHQWISIDKDGVSTVHKAAKAVHSTQSETRFSEPYGNDEAYIDALSRAYREFASLILCRKTTKNLPNQSIAVDQSLRVAGFNDAVLRNMSKDSTEFISQHSNWTPIVIPAVTLLN